MKQRTFRFFVLLTVLFCLTSLMAPLSASAASSAFETMLSRLDTLEALAGSYRSSSGVSTGVDQLMFSYIRSTRYASTTWNTLAGTPDEDFISYVQAQSPDTAALRSMGNITLPNGDSTDAVHMFAVINMIQKGSGDLGGWIGDTCQMLQDIASESGTEDELTAKARLHLRVDGYFGLQDWNADLDGYNLTQAKQNGETWAACLARYFTVSLTEKQRVARFIQSNWGSAYALESATKEKYRSLVKDRFDTFSINVLKVSIFGVWNLPAQEYQNAVCNAVADYCYETVCAPVPDAETVQIDYQKEIIELADGIVANSSADFTGTAYESGCTATPGMVFYAKGPRDVENGTFFPSETVTFSLPQRPDASSAPQLLSADESSLRFVSLEGAEYSIDGGTTWQSSAVFTGLSANTDYRVIYRYPATESSFGSGISAECRMTTTPAGLSLNEEGIFYEEGTGVQLLLAIYAPNGRMASLTFGTVKDNRAFCALPDSLSGGYCRVFALTTGYRPLTETYTVPEDLIGS